MEALQLLYVLKEVLKSFYLSSRNTTVEVLNMLDAASKVSVDSSVMTSWRGLKLLMPMESFRKR